jgi:dihydroorotate dehydrogenase electron transfer subunit
MDSSPRLVTATLVSREFRAPGFWYLRFQSEHIARHARPAQFVALDLPGGFSVRLPLGIYTAHDDTFGLLFKEWGERTSRLGTLPVGAQISCIGPLGNEFPLPKSGERALIVAGGLGVAAFWMLAKALKAASIDATIVLGARSAPHIVGREELRAFGFPFEICTDDGSEGYRGTVVDRLRELPPAQILYGCGPHAMLKALCAYATERDVACQVSLEETFGCSLGTCWGCVVPVRRGCAQGTGYPKALGERRDFDFARVCTDGTVFSSADLVWAS